MSKALHRANIQLGCYSCTKFNTTFNGLVSILHLCVWYHQGKQEKKAGKKTTKRIFSDQFLTIADSPPVESHVLTSDACQAIKAPMDAALLLNSILLMLATRIRLQWGQTRIRVRVVPALDTWSQQWDMCRPLEQALRVVSWKKAAEPLLCIDKRSDRLEFIMKWARL